VHFLKGFISWFIAVPLILFCVFFLLFGAFKGIKDQFEIQFQDSGLTIVWLFLAAFLGGILFWNFRKAEDKKEKKESQFRQDMYDQQIKDQYS
jgi:hypothetical protein